MERFLHMAGMVIMVVSIAIGIVIALSIPYALDGILYALPLYALFLGGLVGLFLFGKKLSSEHDGKQDVKSFKQTVGEGKNISVQRQEPAFQEEHKSVSLEKKESDEKKCQALIQSTANNTDNHSAYLIRISNVEREKDDDQLLDDEAKSHSNAILFERACKTDKLSWLSRVIRKLTGN